MIESSNCLNLTGMSESPPQNQPVERKTALYSYETRYFSDRVFLLGISFEDVTASIKLVAF
jgi:hypothetical protein